MQWIQPLIIKSHTITRLQVFARAFCHTSDENLLKGSGEYSICVGKVIGCLGNRMRGSDTELENHLKTCGKNTRYISETFQNELIYCCSKLIKDALIKDIKETFFFKLADEASDCSNQEQLSYVLRFADKVVG